MTFRDQTETNVLERVHRTLVIVITAGNIGFGVLALAAPKPLGKIMGEREDAVRRIGRKDLAAGLAVAAAHKDPTMPLALNALADLQEGMGWLKKKPLIAAVPLLWS